MSFWSDKKLRENLEGVISPADHSKVDISGYKLSVGNKIFITKDIEKNSEPTTINLVTESYREIPAGQFALITTLEKVTIPKNTIGFISMRAKTKFKGLINVSGFHVDPGYSDHLIFSVFNAGPKPIAIQKGDDIFLIWFADLDQENERSKGNCGLNGNIPSDFISNLNIQVDSAAGLSKKFNDFQDKLNIAKTWGLPLLGLFLPLVIWAASTLYSLDIKSKVFESGVDESSKSIKELTNQIQVLQKNLDDQDKNIYLLSHRLDLESQKQTLNDINKRSIKMEEKLYSASPKK